MVIREVQDKELWQLLRLYSFLHGNAATARSDEVEIIWNQIKHDPHHHILVGVEDETILSSCVLIIVPNFTHNQRPYALVENVVTHPDHRSKGCATQLLDYAKELAAANRCYKIMLMTGSKEERILNFYQRAGYNMNDKTAFIQWLE